MQYKKTICYMLIVLASGIIGVAQATRIFTGIPIEPQWITPLIILASLIIIGASWQIIRIKRQQKKVKNFIDQMALGNVQALEAYLQLSGFDLNQADYLGRYPLETALKAHHLKLSYKLWLKGALPKEIIEKNKINAIPAKLPNMLNYFILKEVISTQQDINFLCAQGADLFIKDAHNKTLLDVAIAQNNFSLSALLIQSGLKLDKTLAEAQLISAFRTKNIAAVQFYLSQGIAIDPFKKFPDYHTPITIALAAERSDIADALLQQPLLDKEGNAITLSTLLETLKEMSIKTKRYLVIKYLLEKGVDFEKPNQDGTSPVYQAIQERDWYFVRLLLKYIDVDKPILGPTGEQLSLLVLAIRSGQTNLVKAISRRTKNINALNEAGFTALHIALQEAQPKKKIIATLLAYKAGWHIADKQLVTPLKLAEKLQETGLDILDVFVPYVPHLAQQQKASIRTFAFFADVSARIKAVFVKKDATAG